MFNLGYLSDGLGCNTCVMHGLDGLGDLGYLGSMGLGELGALHAKLTAAQKQAEKDALAERKAAQAAVAKAKKDQAAAVAAARKASSGLPPAQKAAAVAEAKRAGAIAIASAKTAQVSKAAALTALKKADQLEAKKTAVAVTAQKKADQKKKADDRKAENKQKREDRKKLRVGNRDVAVLPGEEKIAAGANAEATAFLNAAKAAIAAGKSARTPDQKRQAAKMASDALAMMGKAINPAVITQIGKPKANKIVRQTKQVARKGVRGLFGGLFGFTSPAQIAGARANAAYYNQRPGGMTGMGDELNVDGTAYVPTEGTDPMTQMLMAQMMQPPSLPAQCAKRPNSQLCQIAKMSADSQKQMGFLITMVMQMQQQLMGMLQELLAGGGVTGGGEFYPPPIVDGGGFVDSQPYPPIDQGYPGGYPPPSVTPYPESYPSDTSFGGGAPMPTGGAFAQGGVEAIPPGFDGGSAPTSDFMPEGGGEGFIPQDISLSTGGAYSQPAYTPQTYAPAESYVEQEMIQSDQPFDPQSGYIPPQVYADEEYIPPELQAGVPQEIYPDQIVGMDQELATAGAPAGSTQAQIQDMYFDDGGGSNDGF